MSIYRRVVFPHLTHRFLGSRRLGAERRALLESITGVVLEIGLGSGLNIPHYPPAVTKLVGIDPSVEALRLAEAGMRKASFPIQVFPLTCEQLPFEDSTFDAAVLTWTLCMLEQPISALQEIRRVLRPGGRLYFLEHGRSPDPAVAAQQDRWNGVTRRLFAGCNLNRPITELIATTLRVTHLETYYRRGPRIAGYVFRGQAAREA